MKRILLSLCAVLLFASNAIAGTPVKVAHATWVGYGPLYIAKDLGYFDEEGLDVDIMIIEDESQYAAALASGNIDGLGNVLDREVIHYAKGTDEVVIFGMDESSGGDGVVSSAEIKTVADLKGKTVGLDKSSTSYFFFLSILNKYGVEESDINIMEMGASDAGAAFVAGRIDAAVTWEPWLTNAGQRDGGHVLISSKEMPKTIVDVFVLNADYVKAHPEVPAKMTKCWNKAIAWYEQNPDKGNAIMAKAMHLKTQEMADMAAGVTFIGAEENKVFFDKTKENNIYEVADRAITFWKSKGIITKDVDLDALITPEYVNAK
ncbi:Aliphatic sulfonates family ABC transporter, periplasmic ligand-binding protein [Pseudodesulfovibrio profundus]|uniref:Aliphatic sulfonates family ABC transporter, periplasmic ligand-binding protein n=1 Tax=Pseudodesulfovibrio profundus TaxID=57320 RepID=A0A2C8FDB5_9BACT|nr:ABC transporter substrate-binding protein [Pseudodesulfovibrio profundus]MBC16986.1 taurine ABC transporter substrate-binding protein [Desulfovibrio sp.]SOB60445.1 Aliphatic sulfonates family ABC transporter, periplasmic ligand-binding protein [Pseudodesulfovibrio profundus]|tara:strand:- start:12963 stop:13919 length:957 start_codon:yes stop_codon:yes gene_type:complete